MEYYITCKESDATCKWDELNSCRICMCPLYDDIDEGDELNKQLHKAQRELMTKVQ